jgi:glycosyltransferase involved in cell wall biosynthesis
MKIGLDGNEANVKNRVGSGIYAYELLKEFAKIKTHRFTVYLKEKPLNDLPKITQNFKYKIFGPKKLWTQVALPLSLTFGQRPDVFFSLGHYGPRFSRIPYAITIFDLSYLLFPELFKKDDLYQLTNWSKYSIKNSKHIFAISGSTKADIVKNYQVSSEKITVTHMGYNRTLFKPQPRPKIDSIMAKYKIKGDYIIFVGTLQPRKNIESLLETFGNLILDSKSTLQLVIVGKKGWQYDSIFQKVKDLNLTSSVIFTDYVPQEDLPPLISGSKLYILPSLYEGFGIPVIEAQACGVPVVVSNTSSLPEIVGESGILVDPQSVDSIANGIKKVLTSEKERTGFIKKGFENIERFSWQKCASQTLQILENL